MKMLRATAAALLFASALGAAPALAQPGDGGAGAGFGSAEWARSKPGKPGGGAGDGNFGEREWARDRGSRGDWCRKRRWCRDRSFFGYGYGYGGGIGHDRMIAGGEFGYYAQDADRPEVANGQAHYDYDRGYPYEYYRETLRMNLSEARRDYTARSRHCQTERTRDRRSGREVEVRVCRN